MCVQKREMPGRLCFRHSLDFLDSVLFSGCRWSESGSGPAFEAEQVSPLVTWQDGRCSPTFLASLPLPQSHVSLATGFGCATVYWYLKNRYIAAQKVAFHLAFM